ncbi:MAG: hypothetical protein R3Y24_13135 [Eubacteriales bacterium]
MKIRNGIANVIMVILGVFIAILIVATISMMVTRNNWDKTDEISLLYDIDQGEYDDLVDDIFGYPRIENSEIYDQCEAIACYYLAASLYHAYEQTGNQEEATRYKSQMDEQLTKFGDLYFIEYEINDKLGIQ